MASLQQRQAKNVSATVLNEESMPHPPQVTSPSTASSHEAQVPVWLQRLSLFILVLFCIYLGGLMTVLPWWPSMWDRNPLILAYPQLSLLMHSGITKGIISGIGLLDIWIGISELIQYRDYRG